MSHNGTSNIYLKAFHIAQVTQTHTHQFLDFPSVFAAGKIYCWWFFDMCICCCCYCVVVTVLNWLHLLHYILLIWQYMCHLAAHLVQRRKRIHIYIRVYYSVLSVLSLVSTILYNDTHGKKCVLCAALTGQRQQHSRHTNLITKD